MSDADKVKADHAKAGKLVSPTEDPTDHSIGGGAAKASAAAASAKAAEEDNTITGKINRSGLYFVRDHSVGGEPYIGISPVTDPKASPASQERSLVATLNTVAPRTGMQIRLKDGKRFSVADGFGPDTTPADWAKVVDPATGQPLFA